MGRATRRFLGVAIVTPFVIAACHNDRRKDDPEMADAKMVARDTTPLRPGDIRIVTESGSIELALLGDSIVTGLGPAVLDKVRDKTDTNAVSGNGFGAGIEKMVKSTVASAMSQQLQYPLSSIKDVRYENGKLEFYYKDGTSMKIFENSKDRGKPVSESFRPEDAQRFVDAVHARMASAKG